MKCSVLVDNKTELGDCCAEWGLSLWIENRGEKLLLDTGLSSMFLDNARAMNVDLSTADSLVISHGHFDHTGGVEAFSQIAPHAPIYLHEEALYETFGETDGVMDDYNCGILWDDALKEKLRPQIQFTNGTKQIGPHSWIIGNIPSMAEYPPTERFFRKAADGNLEPDPMNHEQVLVIEENGRLHVFSGCSHKGVIPILRHVAYLFPQYKIAGMIAGMHLHSLTPQKRAAIIDEFQAMGLDYVVPLHCTGMNAIVEMKVKMGDACHILCAGHSLTV